MGWDAVETGGQDMLREREVMGDGPFRPRCKSVAPREGVLGTRHDRCVASWQVTWRSYWEEKARFQRGARDEGEIDPDKGRSSRATRQNQSDKTLNLSLPVLAALKIVI